MQHKDMENIGEIKEAIEKLDKSIPQNGAHVRFMVDGDSPKMSKIEATRRGYLRLGVEFLKAALDSKEKGKHDSRVDINLDYLNHNGSDIEFQDFEVLSDTQFDGLHAEPEETSYKAAMLYVGTFFIVLFLLAVLLFTNVFSSIVGFFLGLLAKLNI